MAVNKIRKTDDDPSKARSELSCLEWKAKRGQEGTERTWLQDLSIIVEGRRNRRRK